MGVERAQPTQTNALKTHQGADQGKTLCAGTAAHLQNFRGVGRLLEHA